MHFLHQSRLSASPEAVFAFHEREDVLQLLLPPWQRAEVISRQGGLKPGARVEFRLYFGPFYLTWLALHTEYEHNRLFVDKQLRGPFSQWRHRHEFIADGDGCILRDDITFTLPFGLTPLLGWLVVKDLRRMFEYRHRVTARALLGSGRPDS